MTKQLDTSQITNPAVLAWAFKHVARFGCDEAVVRGLEERAVALDADLPADWPPKTTLTTAPAKSVTLEAPAAAPVTVARAAAKVAPSVQLDQPAHELFTLDRREDYDRVLRAVSRELDAPYHEAMEALDRSYKTAQSRYRTTPPTVREVLGGAGAKELDALQTAVFMLEQRDELVGRQLDAALAPVRAERVDGQGRVMLDEDFDVAALLHSPEVRERRWRAARELDQRYQNRSTWDTEDTLHLDSGIDLLASMTRPLRIAQASSAAATTGKELDAIIESDRDQRTRTRELDAAIAALTDRRAEVTGGLTKTLERHTTAVAELSAAGVRKALALQRHTPGMSLEDAAVRTLDGLGSALPLAGPDHSRTVAAQTGAGRGELDQRIRAAQGENGGDYLAALEAVTGVSLGSRIAGR
jgi:hypothetical protein